MLLTSLMYFARSDDNRRFSLCTLPLLATLNWLVNAPGCTVSYTIFISTFGGFQGNAVTDKLVGNMVWCIRNGSVLKPLSNGDIGLAIVPYSGIL